MSRNDITGAVIRSKNNDAEARKRFEEGYERIFGKKPTAENVVKPPPGYTAEELEKDNPYNQWMNEK